MITEDIDENGSQGVNTFIGNLTFICWREAYTLEFCLTS